MTAGRNEWSGTATAGTPAPLPVDLGKFLFAEAGVEAGGMSLTTLSALARLGLDPWDEAGRLARLPRQDAAGELARSLAELPGRPLPDTAGIAARLVALLPGGGAAPLSPLPASANAKARTARRWAVLLASAAVLTGLAVLAGHRFSLLAAPDGAAAAPPPSAAARNP
jgi:hypothetical protein